MRFQAWVEDHMSGGVRRALKFPWLPIPGRWTYSGEPECAALWDFITAVPLWRHHLLLSVQLICICREDDEVLVLFAAEYPGQCTLLQGLRHWERFGLFRPRYREDPTGTITLNTCAREACEEALKYPPSADNLALALRYREGIFGQFLSFVYVWVIDEAKDKPPLHGPTPEGRPCWLPREKVDTAFHDPNAARMVHDVFEGRLLTPPPRVRHGHGRPARS